jgi:hypothetical protein
MKCNVFPLIRLGAYIKENVIENSILYNLFFLKKKKIKLIIRFIFFTRRFNIFNSWFYKSCIKMVNVSYLETKTGKKQKRKITLLKMVRIGEDLFKMCDNYDEKIKGSTILSRNILCTNNFHPLSLRLLPLRSCSENSMFNNSLQWLLQGNGHGSYLLLLLAYISMSLSFKFHFSGKLHCFSNYL